MRKSIIVITLLLLSIKIAAQVGIGTISPDPATALDIVSSDKGFLPPRVANVATITTPVAGLMIYDLSHQCMRYYNGTIWSNCMGGESTCDTTMTDIDGNTYPTVLIDGKCWMAEDLKVSRYPNGDAIPYIDDDTSWGALANNNIDDAYSFYGDNDNDGAIDIAYSDYGALYTYAAAIADDWTRDNNANQGICPDGWHLPTDSEWTTLTDYLGGAGIAGGKMKETGTTHWISPNTGATNSSGFTALPGGWRSGGNNGTFSNLGNYGFWWSGTEYSSSDAYIRRLSYDLVKADRYYYIKSDGFCVRCIRD